MKEKDNLVGRIFNYLTVLQRDTSKPTSKGIYYFCKCGCGNVKSVRKDGLLTSNTKSCGCMKIRLQQSAITLPTNTEFFFKESDELSYFLGLFTADGYLTKDNKIGIQLQEQDLSILLKISHLIYGKNMVKKIEKREDKSVNTGVQYRLCFTNHCVLRLLKEYGYTTQKTIDAKVPPHLIFNHHFWRGMIDGDGCITKFPNFIVELIGTKDVIGAFVQFCNSINLGIGRNESRLGRDKYNIPMYGFRLNGTEAVLFCKCIYTDKGNMFIERKYKRFTDYLEFKTN